MLNVPLANIFEALQVNLGSVYVNDFNLFGRTFQVRAQAGGEFRAKPEDIGRLKTRNTTGQMVPLASVVNVDWRSGPDRVVRYNMFPGAEVQADAAPGRSSGDAIAAVERLAREKLPSGMAIEWTELAYQERLAGNTALYIFPAVRAVCVPRALGRIRKLVAAAGDHSHRAGLLAVCTARHLGSRNG